MNFGGGWLQFPFMSQHRRGSAAALLVLLCATLRAPALENELARTPPMGWNSWYPMGTKVDDKGIRATIDAVVANGLKQAGYIYVNIDDGWSRRDSRDAQGNPVSGRDEHGNLVPDPQRFPNGMRALADYAHSKGLKLGIYSNAGARTCSGYPGSQGREQQDANLFAAWGIDYVKHDWCNVSPTAKAPELYRLMGQHLAKTDRRMVFSICDWGSSNPWTWAGEVGNLWRTGGDLAPNWLNILSVLDQQVGLESYAGPGRWNDPDILHVGNGRLTLDQNRAQLSLWSILAAPLLIGTDVRKAEKDVLGVLTRREVIAVNQDPLGIQGAKVSDTGDLEVWARPLKDRAQAVVLLNRTQAPAKIAVKWSELGWPSDLAARPRDLWTGQDMEEAHGGLSTEVPAYGAFMVRLTAPKLPTTNLPPVGRLVIGDGSPVGTLYDTGRIRLRVLPYDADGRVTKVEVLEGDKSIQSFAGGPYHFQFQRPPGLYRLTARITDDAGATSTTEPLELKIELKK